MSDNLNDAHLPEVDAAPPNLHPTPTRLSGLADELRAGTVNVAGQPAPTKITPHSPLSTASRGMPIVDSAPSGARILAHSPLDASRDTTGRE